MFLNIQHSTDDIDHTFDINQDSDFNQYIGINPYELLALTIDYITHYVDINLH